MDIVLSSDSYYFIRLELEREQAHCEQVLKQTSVKSPQGQYIYTRKAKIDKALEELIGE
jgi:hypothetical protein